MVRFVPKRVLGENASIVSGYEIPQKCRIALRQQQMHVQSYRHDSELHSLNCRRL